MDVSDIYAAMLADERKRSDSGRAGRKAETKKQAPSVYEVSRISSAFSQGTTSKHAANTKESSLKSAKQVAAMVLGGDMPVTKKSAATAVHIDATSALLNSKISAPSMASIEEKVIERDRVTFVDSDAPFGEERRDTDGKLSHFTSNSINLTHLKAMAAFESADDLLAHLRRVVAVLSNESESVAARKSAMRSFTTTCFGVDLTDNMIDITTSASVDGDERAADEGAVVCHARPLGDGTAAAIRLDMKLESHESRLLCDMFPHVSKLLCRRCADSSEGVRLAAVQSITLLLATGFARRHIPANISYVVSALADILASPHVYDFEKKIFAADTVALEAYQRGRIIDSQQSMLASSEGELFTSGSSESAESVRLAVSRCLRGLLMETSQADFLAVLDAYWHDIFMIAHTLSIDSSPDVRIDGCALLELLAVHIPTVCRFYSPGLIRSLMPVGLVHRLARVRIATMAAIDLLVVCPDESKGRAAGSEALLAMLGARDANVVPVSSFYKHETTVNYFAKLVVDPNPLARHRFLQMLCHWMTAMIDRHEWWSRLLPYLLSCMSDDLPAPSEQRRYPDHMICCPAVGGPCMTAEELIEAAPHMSGPELCLATLNTLGAEHEREHLDKLLPALQSGVDGDPEGTRLFVRANCTRFIKAVLSEMADFTPFGDSWAAMSGINTRIRAGQLLLHVLAFMEESVTQDISLLVPAIIGSIHDVGDFSGCCLSAPPVLPRDSLGAVAAAAARLMGRYLHPSVYVPVIMPYITGEISLGRSGVMASEAQQKDSIGHSHELSSAAHVLWIALSEASQARVAESAGPILRALAATGCVAVVQEAFSRLMDVRQAKLPWMDAAFDVCPPKEITPRPPISSNTSASSVTFHLLTAVAVIFRAVASTGGVHALNRLGGGEVLLSSSKLFHLLLQLLGRGHMLELQLGCIFTHNADAVSSLALLDTLQKPIVLRQNPIAILQGALHNCAVSQLKTASAADKSGLDATSSFSLTSSSVLTSIMANHRDLLIEALADFPDALAWSPNASQLVLLSILHHPQVLQCLPADEVVQCLYFALDLIDTCCHQLTRCPPQTPSVTTQWATSNVLRTAHVDTVFSILAHRRTERDALLPFLAKYCLAPCFLHLLQVGKTLETATILTLHGRLAHHLSAKVKPDTPFHATLATTDGSAAVASTILHGWYGICKLPPKVPSGLLNETVFVNIISTLVGPLRSTDMLLNQHSVREATLLEVATLDDGDILPNALLCSRIEALCGIVRAAVDPTTETHMKRITSCIASVIARAPWVDGVPEVERLHAMVLNVTELVLSVAPDLVTNLLEACIISFSKLGPGFEDEALVITPKTCFYDAAIRMCSAMPSSCKDCLQNCALWAVESPGRYSVDFIDALEEHCALLSKLNAPTHSPSPQMST